MDTANILPCRLGCFGAMVIIYCIRLHNFWKHWDIAKAQVKIWCNINLIKKIVFG